MRAYVNSCIPTLQFCAYGLNFTHGLFSFPLGARTYLFSDSLHIGSLYIRQSTGSRSSPSASIVARLLRITQNLMLAFSLLARNASDGSFVISGAELTNPFQLSASDAESQTPKAGSLSHSSARRQLIAGVDGSLG